MGYKEANASDEKEDENNDTVDAIKDPFPSCTLFTLTTRRRWHQSISLNAKFPNLLFFQSSLEWYSQFDLIQQFLDSHAESIRILFLDFSFKIQPQDREQWTAEALDPNNDNPTRLKLTLPPNVEICALSCLYPESAEFIDIDFSECRHNLKQLNLLKNTVPMCNAMFLDGKGNEKLQYLVINDIDGVHKIKWDALKIGTGEMNKLVNIHVPCTPQFANKISSKCIGEFPDLEEVKEVLESLKTRKMLRDLNCVQRRHFLWGLFWYNRDGIGKQKLKALEMEWRRQQSTEMF